MSKGRSDPDCHAIIFYFTRRNFRTRFNFVYFVLFAERTKFSGIPKPCKRTSLCETTLVVLNFSCDNFVIVCCKVA